MQKPNKIIIGDPFSPENVKTKLIMAGACIVLSFSTIFLSAFWPEAIDREPVWSLLVIGVVLLAHEIIVSSFLGKRQGQTGSLIFDERGIGGMQVGAAVIDERIAWSRIKNVENDGSAVILQFEPVDLNSETPSDRISQVRLSYGDKAPEEIEQAILKFWRASKD